VVPILISLVVSVKCHQGNPGRLRFEQSGWMLTKYELADGELIKEECHCGQVTETDR